jgi:pyruvate dehydrogenase E2 component (dihydrolipoamide acetyltransferase)
MTALAIWPEGGEGPDCLLLHGFGSDRLSWVGVAPALASLVSVHSLDLPGHGDAGPDVGDGSPHAFALRVEAALAAKGVRRVHLVGHSLGGGVALILAERRPDLVATLTLISPVGLGERLDADFLAAYPALASLEETLALLRTLVVRPHMIGKQVAQRALAQLGRPGARDALAKVADALLASEAPLAAAATAAAARAIPRLTIWGEEDRVNALSAARLDAFGGERFTIAGAGHLPHVENAKRVNEVIAAFLAEHAAA